MDYCGAPVEVDEQTRTKKGISNSFLDNKKDSTVIFNVKAKTSYGEQVFIVGNCAALGDWNILQAAKMKTDESSYPIWCASLQLEQGKAIEYKYVIRGDWDADFVIWETGSNRKLGVHGLWMVIDDSYFGSGTKELVKFVSENNSSSPEAPSSARPPLSHSSSFGSTNNLPSLSNSSSSSSSNTPPQSPNNIIPPSPFSSLFIPGNNNERQSSEQPANNTSQPRISRYHMFNNSLWNDLNDQLEIFSQLESKHMAEKTKLERELAETKQKLQASETALQQATKELSFLQGKDMKYFSVPELKKLAQTSNKIYMEANHLMIKKLEDYVEFSVIQQECVACMDKPIDTLIQPCGHYVTCDDCGRKVSKCPVCNVKITKLQKVYTK